MATSSIFANIEINDVKTAERFISALESSYEDSKQAPIIYHKAPLIDDIETIRTLFSKKRVNDGV